MMKEKETEGLEWLRTIGIAIVIAVFFSNFFLF